MIVNILYKTQTNQSRSNKTDFKKVRLQIINQQNIKIGVKWITTIVEAFDPAINYGPNDAGISAITIIFAIFSLIVFSWLFAKTYAQLVKFFEKDGKNNE